LNKLVTYFFDKLQAFEEALVLRKTLVLYIIFKSIYWLWDYDLLFSDHSMIYKNDVPVPVWQWPAFILYRSHSMSLPMIFLGMLIMVSLYVLFSKKTFRLAFFILWIIMVNMINSVYCAASAGDMLSQHLLFFCIFLSDGSAKTTALGQALDTVFHNSGLIALRVQVCIVYFYAALTKLFDQDWINGDAINITLAIHDYSLPVLYEGYGGIGKVLNYLVLWYQLLFPVLVWIKPIKKWYLLIGILQHLFIAFALGLPSFGFIMIVAYAIFYVPYSKTQKTS
jgi:hypothetical protein